jgi:hypothetical protein
LFIEIVDHPPLADFFPDDPDDIIPALVNGLVAQMPPGPIRLIDCLDTAGYDRLRLDISLNSKYYLS